MRWLALMTKDGAKDKYAVGFVTHTVAMTVDAEGRAFTAWRLAADSSESESLGVFRGDNGFELAKLCVENAVRMEAQAERKRA